MALRLPKRQRALPIGVDLGFGSVQLAQLRPAGDGAELVACAALAVPRELFLDQFGYLAFLATELPLLIKRQGFQGRQCVVSIPAEHTFVRHVKVPRADARATEAAARAAVQAELPYALSDASFCHIVAGEAYNDGSAKQEVIAVAVQLSTLNAYLSALDQAGLEVVGVSIPAVALAACFRALLREPDRAVLFLEMAATNVHVAICHGPRIAFSRNLPQDARNVDQAIAQGLNVALHEVGQIREDLKRGRDREASGDAVYRSMTPWIEQLAREIGTCLAYHHAALRCPRVDRVVFVGDAARDKRLCTALARRLNVSAQIGNPLAGVSVAPVKGLEASDKAPAAPSLAVSVGLSLCGLVELGETR